MEKWIVRFISLFTGAVGILNVFSAIKPPLIYHLTQSIFFYFFEMKYGGRLTVVLAGFALLLLAENLWRRKRAAWLLTIFIIIISIAVHLSRGFSIETVVWSIVLLIILLFLGPYFHARSDRPSIGGGLKVLLTALVFIFIYGITGIYLLDSHFKIYFSFYDALKQVVFLFMGLQGSGLIPLTKFSSYFLESISTVGYITIGYAFIMIVRPVLLREPATPTARQKSRKIVEEYGASSLARILLLDDKSYYFSSGGSVIGFVVKGRTALCLGDPVGPDKDISSAISDFVKYCSDNDWQVAFYQVKPDYLDNYKANGFDAICIGEEAVVDVSAFTLSGKVGSEFRNYINRLSKRGYRTEFYDLPLSDKLIKELRLVSDEWLTMVHGQEQRFSLGWFYDEYVRECQVMAVHSPDGSIAAFANIIPEYCLNGTTIDIMRRRRKFENGIMDMLFVSIIQWAKEKGFATFSLGLSPLSGVGTKSEDKAVERAFHYIYENMNRFYNFKGLHRFKEKFKPRWEPRYLIYPGISSLPSVLMALIRANTGDGFVIYYIKDFIGNMKKKQSQG